MLTIDTPSPVHIPANPDCFEFDDEVASIFPNMAKRSIPNYVAFHRAHAEIVATFFADRPGCRMLDVGASHGAFYSALMEFYHRTGATPPPMKLEATDCSQAMCNYMKQSLPGVDVAQESLLSLEFFEREENVYDVINCTFVIQFIAPELQYAVLGKLNRMLKPGGILILGQKESHSKVLGFMLHEQYLQWRMANGYTRAEIDAKTKALAGSMWPLNRTDLNIHLNRNYREVAETSRMFMFSTLIAYK